MVRHRRCMSKKTKLTLIVIPSLLMGAAAVIYYLTGTDQGRLDEVTVKEALTSGDIIGSSRFAIVERFGGADIEYQRDNLYCLSYRVRRPGILKLTHGVFVVRLDKEQLVQSADYYND